MPIKSHSHNGDGECVVCGIAFAHEHPDVAKPKEFFVRPMPGEQTIIRASAGDAANGGKKTYCPDGCPDTRFPGCKHGRVVEPSLDIELHAKRSVAQSLLRAGEGVWGKSPSRDGFDEGFIAGRAAVLQAQREEAKRLGIDLERV